MAVCMVSPFGLWLLGTSKWNSGIGTWLWVGGLVIGWAFGTSVGQQWELIDELERTRTRLAEVAVADERRRIARELHDLVGHNFSVVLLHLAGARMVLSSEPAAAAAALRDAEEVGRRGMDELRQALLLMRDGTGESLAPVEASNLDGLVGRYREAGMRVDLVGDDIDGLASGPGIVLHDIVREALTNVAKHSLDRAATIRLSVGADAVDVRIENLRQPGPAPDGPGLGLSGLEHRVAAVGGTFSAGPAGDSWVVAAQVPTRLPEPPSPTADPQPEPGAAA
jgi:signal transduction histidine kinase